MNTNTAQPSTPSKSGARRTNALPSGYHLDEYRIDAILGAGGFGVTYKALDTHLDAWVAIKEYFPVEWSFRDADGVMVYANTQGLSSAAGGQTSDYEWGLERFLDEARVLARIQHPYVVRVKRYFRANGTAYIVMEYEEGEPLSTILDESKTLGEDQVRGLLEDVLPALQAVHEQGYLHRDIKPANLYVRARDHRVMLIDFGAARAAINRHSQSVTSLVTPGYSPPEQYTTRNDRYGTWTDLYALGAVLYRCVIGHTPAEAAERLLDDHLAPAVTAGAGRYSSNLLRVIDRALAVRPEMRFRDVAEMQAALAGSQDDGSDETVIMMAAPVIRSGKPSSQEPTARSVSGHPPTAPPPPKMEFKEGKAETTPPAVKSPRLANQQEAPAASPANANSPPRRAPMAILAGGVVAVAVATALMVAWLWPSAPAPQPSLVGQGPHGQPTEPVAARPPSSPASGVPESTVTPPPPTAPPAEIGSATGVAPVESATPSASAPPLIVETTLRESPPTPAPGGEPSAPLLEHQGQVVQPVRFQEEPTVAQPAQRPEEPTSEKAPEAVATEPRVLPSPPPTPASRENPLRPGAANERVATKPDADKKAPARVAEPTRSRTARSKDRRGQTRPTSTVATPAAPTRSAPSAHAGNPWESPTSTGFNQK
ncbi:MAG: protein kinase [Candidatus Contendobacter sp.]|nr:protein kinase [Candidatus Contendobacter sp.]MDS4057207.1 protein kinase [Candidatus Contendobacter sp.]